MKILAAVIVIVLAAGALYIYSQQAAPPQKQEKVGDVCAGEKENATDSVHWHADLAVYLRGQKLDFSQPKYMEGVEAVHLHDGNGNVVHKHRLNVTWYDFFSSLNIKFDAICMVMEEGTYCANTYYNERIRMYVNGNKSRIFQQEPIKDLDRVLIVYGNETDEEILQKYVPTVSNDSCIYSEKCPERGKPKEEAC